MVDSTRHRLIEQRQHGAAAIELALAAPFLLILVLGIVDLGRGLFTYIAIQEAAQEGALYGAFDPSDFTEIRNRVTSSVDKPSIAGGDITVSCDSATDQITVTVDNQVPMITPLLSQWFGGQLALSATVTGDVLLPGGCP